MAKRAAARWCLLVKIYRKMSLFADWNSVWYKLPRFYGALMHPVVERLNNGHGSWPGARTEAMVTAELADKMETLSYQR
jgi:hypothetical protein